MRMKIFLRSTAFVVALTTAVPTLAASELEVANNKLQYNWVATTGLGYDNNVYQAPRAPYVDYAALPAGSNPTVVPQKKSGFFAPYEIKVNATYNLKQDTRLLGSAALDGSFYVGGGLSSANELNLDLQGGPEFVLSRDGKVGNTVYVGALVEKHKQVYVDHDSGLDKTSALSGTDISGRYSYIGVGAEAEYKHKIGKIDYSFDGKYVFYDFEDPVVVSQMDHNYLKLGADASIPLVPHTKLNVSFDHSVRDYSKRHSRNAQGSLLNANPLLQYSYNSLGATLRNRISADWLIYVDYDHRQRADNYVSYNDYRQNRLGARLLYGAGRLKARLSLHHFKRDYPNGFAFDIAGQGAKKYSGNNLKLKAELEQTKNTSLWSEMIYRTRNATDLRYDYSRIQIMVGMSWAH